MRALVLIGLLSGALLSLSACLAQDEEVLPGGSPSPSTGELAFQTIELGQTSGIQEESPQLFLIQMQQEWRDFWGRHSAGTEPAPPIPQVDFGSDMVIAVVDRNEPSGGYRFQVDSIEVVGGRLEVKVNKESPGDGCITTQAFTQPYHFVRLARTPLEPRLVIAEQPYAC